MKYLIAFSLLLTTPAFAQDSATREIAEGKTPAIEALWMKELEKGLDQKQQKTMALISLVASKMNHATDENRREEAEYAHVGFSARFQNIREERADLAKKGQALDYAHLQVYSKRLEVLITDLQTFLK
jgi:hypothetical protein